MASLHANIATLEKIHVSVSIFVVVSHPANAKLVRRELGTAIAHIHELSADEERYAAELVEGASGKSVETKGHLLQWAKLYLGLVEIVKYEREHGMCFNFIAKQRFDHNIRFTSVKAARQLMAAASNQQDSVWHSVSDLFLLGSRRTMGKVLSALFTGGCSMHPLGTHFSPGVLSRPHIDLLYICRHAVLPPYAKTFKTRAKFLEFLRKGSTAFSLAHNDTGVFFDLEHSYSPRDSDVRQLRKPDEHYCYSEAELVGTVLTHKLAFYDAGEPPFRYVAGSESVDWQLNLNVTGKFDSRLNPAVGRPRNNLKDIKLFVRGQEAQIRLNKYQFQFESEVEGRDRFISRYIRPILVAAAVSEETRRCVETEPLLVERSIDCELGY